MSETAITSLPGVTLDPKDEAGLETAFGVTSNAEELVKHNRSRYTPEQRKASARRVNHDLSERVQEREEYDPERAAYGAPADAVEAALEDHVGHPVERAVVRGKGRQATISYSFIGDRGDVEKGVVPFVDVFGSAQQKRSAKRSRKAAAKTDPDAAAGAKIEEADEAAQAKIKAAQEEAEQALADAREQAAKAIEEAHAEAAKIREKAAEDAAKAAAKAEAEAKKQAAKGSGSGSAKGRSRSSGD